MTDKTKSDFDASQSNPAFNDEAVNASATTSHPDRGAREDARAHLNPRIFHLLDAPQHQRIEHILMDRIIPYPVFEGILEEVHWLIMAPKCSRARGLIVEGVPNSGKTEIANTVLRHYPISAIDTPTNRRPRAVFISISGARTTKAILNRILEKIGVPTPQSSTMGDREALVIHSLRKMNCCLLIIDEIQDALNFRESEQVRVFEVIKYLMNELRMPVLALGADRAAGAFRADKHLAARFDAITIPQWVVGNEFAHFLRTYEEYLPLKFRSDLARPEIQKILIKETGGITGDIVKKINILAMNAVVSGEERITQEALKQAQVRPPVSVLRSQINE